MKPQLEIVSREVVKPSSTKKHPPIYNLSFFDQIAPQIYASFVYFYANQYGSDHIQNDNAQKSNLLRTSLSNILSKHYPLAGRTKDNTSVVCNDQGIMFIVAQMKCKLSDFLSSFSEEIMECLIPDGLQGQHGSLSSRLVFQVTFYDCGGMALAVCVDHKILDMASACFFINYWATNARTGQSEEGTSSAFGFGTRYPPLDLPSKTVHLELEQNLATRRLIIDAPKIAKLKAMVAEQVQNPTRVELVNALILSRAISAARASSGLSKPTAMFQTTNLRTRVSPPLPGMNMGNFAPPLEVVKAEKENQVNLHFLVQEMKQRKTTFFTCCREKSSGKELSWVIFEGFRNMAELMSKKETDVYISTSWCNFPVYEADFGWGKPAWVSACRPGARNILVLNDTRRGNGIEAVLTLEEHVMALFERDPELLQFADFLHPTQHLNAAPEFVRSHL